MSCKTRQAVLAVTAMLAMTAGGRARPPSTTRPAPTFTNPIKSDGADPWMQYVDGWYYLSTTTGNDVRLRRAHHLADLATATDEVVWKDATEGRNTNLWAPEFHHLDDGTGQMRWYLYYTASKPNEEPSHRLYVAESARDDIGGPYTFKAKLKTDARDEFYAIDGTVFDGPKGEHYCAWCGRPSATGQGLFLSRMANPWTLQGDRLALQADGFGCPVVREGPVTLRHAGKIFLIYSMCDTGTPDYRLGMLVADENADLLDAKSWKQYPKVVFARNDAAGVFGPGHNFFFTSPDGREDWIVYHAKAVKDYTYAYRSTRAQPFTWDVEGNPDFGVPVAEGVELTAPGGE